MCIYLHIDWYNHVLILKDLQNVNRGKLNHGSELNKRGDSCDLTLTFVLGCVVLCVFFYSENVKLFLDILKIFSYFLPTTVVS